MSDLIIACASDTAHRSGYFDQLEAQVRAAGLPFVWEPLDPFSWRRLVDWERDFARRNPGKRIVFTDTADMLFVGTAEELDAIVPHDMILYHGEARCWPEPHLLDFYPPAKGPHRFVNGTGPAGPSDKIIEVVDWIETNSPIRGDEASIFADNDQRAFTHAYLAGIGRVDEDARLSVQLNAVNPYEVSIEGKRLVLQTGVKPVFIHLNGASKFIYGPIVSRLLS